jgi:hypothetical protein
MSNSIVKVISSSISKARQKIKFQRFGADDVQEKFQTASPGVDASPIKDMVAVYAKTSVEGDEVVIGYINKNCIAEPGEIRIFSTDETGNDLKAYLHCKSDGLLELNGSADFAVRYNALNTGLSNQDTQINTELTKIATAINAIVPGSYTPVTVSTDISNSKVDEVKLP